MSKKGNLRLRKTIIVIDIHVKGYQYREKEPENP
jgi:hypothetical protein